MIYISDDEDEFSSDIDDESSCMLEEILLEEFEEDNTTMSSLSWSGRGNDEYSLSSSSPSCSPSSL